MGSRPAQEPLQGIRLLGMPRPYYATALVFPDCPLVMLPVFEYNEGVLSTRQRIAICRCHS